MSSSENQNHGMGGSQHARCKPEIRQTAELVQYQAAQLLQQRAAVVKRIAMIRRAIAGLNAIFPDSAGGQDETAKEPALSEVERISRGAPIPSKELPRGIPPPAELRLRRDDALRETMCNLHPT